MTSVDLVPKQNIILKKDVYVLFATIIYLLSISGKGIIPFKGTNVFFNTSPVNFPLPNSIDRWDMTPQGTGAMGQKLDAEEVPFRRSGGSNSGSSCVQYIWRLECRMYINIEYINH